MGEEGPPRNKVKKKWTLFFELFDLSDHYMFEHLSLHIHFRAFKPSYGSVSAGREKWPFRVTFFLKWKAGVAKPSDIDDFFRFAVTYHDFGMPLK